MLRWFGQNIIAQIRLLLGLSIVVLIGLNYGHSLLTQRNQYLDGLLHNEQVKVELAHLLQQKLLSINIGLHDLSNVNSTGELHLVKRTLHTLQNDIMRYLLVIEHGGTSEDSYPVNFGNEESIRRSLTYINYYPQRIDVEIIELRAKMVELAESVEEFQALAENKIAVLESRDAALIAETIRRFGHHYKGLEPFYVRILENSNRLYFNSKHEVELIQKFNDKFSRTYDLVEMATVCATTIFLVLTGGMILTSSRKILRERSNYQHALQETNDNLETIVSTRTSELEKEITERKNAQIQLTAQTDFLLNVIESLDHPFIVIDVENYAIKIANSAARTTEDESDCTCYALTHQRHTPCDGQAHPCPLQMVKQTRKPVIVEHLHYNKNGEQIYVEVHGYPIFATDGTLVQMIEYALDITDKKRAQLALIQANDRLEEKVKARTHDLEEQIQIRQKAQQDLANSERHFRRLIENVSDLITIVDVQGVIQYTSPAAQRLLGVAATDLIGRDVRSMIHKDDVKHIDIKTLYDHWGSSTPFEYRVIDQNNHIHVMESYVQQFTADNGEDQYILNSRDVTLRKQAEAENRKLSLVVEQNPSSVVITDTEGRIEYVNPHFEAATGYTFAEVKGKNPRILNAGLTPKNVFEDLWGRIKGGEVWQGEFINKKKNGEIYEESAIVLPIKDLAGTITHFVALKENITELKKARRLAEQANLAKSTFLSRMSHELRTPLNAINGFSQLMLQSKKNPLNEKQHNMVEQISSAGKHLLALINEVLDLSSIEAGKLNLSLEDINPVCVISDCLSLVYTQAQQREVTITNNCTLGHYPFVRADYTRTIQVLLNFLSNAVKYNRVGGSVTIDLDATDPAQLKFVVSDSGIGIAKERQGELFVPFSRLSENQDTIEGTGIGMTITKQLVEKMHGQIGFSSTIGAGSTFWFTLPIALPGIINQVQDSIVHPNAEHLVLYIEDNPESLKFMQSIFEEQGTLGLVTRFNAEDGFTAALELAPKLILLDINLPGMDGYQCLERLKAHPATAAIPVIAISVDDLSLREAQLSALGFSAYLTKPIDVERLKYHINDVLEIPV